ncbi:MAG: RNA polymerase sigma factor [Eubacterium sp.]|nr:RNA polymerase sigma factor [Candidatus Colimonas fimequi]
MATLDYNYIESLVNMAQRKDSNAFAELYAATYQMQYAYSCHYLGDPVKAQYAVQETYIKALRGITTLRDSKLFVPWLNQLNFKVCFTLINEHNPEKNGIEVEREPIVIDGRQFRIGQVLALPFTEAQSIILHYYNGMNDKEIARLMDISRGSARRAIRNGTGRLAALMGEGGDDDGK